MKKHPLQKHLPFILAIALAGVMAWYYDVFVNWQPNVFPVAVALSVLVFLSLAVSVIWPGEGKPIKKCLQIFIWLGLFLGVEQGVSYLVHNVIYYAHWQQAAMGSMLPLLALLTVLLLVKPFRVLGRRRNSRWAFQFWPWFAPGRSHGPCLP